MPVNLQMHSKGAKTLHEFTRIKLMNTKIISDNSLNWRKLADN